MCDLTASRDAIKRRIEATKVCTPFQKPARIRTSDPGI